MGWVKHEQCQLPHPPPVLVPWRNECHQILSLWGIATVNTHQPAIIREPNSKKKRWWIRFIFTKLSKNTGLGDGFKYILGGLKPPTRASSSSKQTLPLLVTRSFLSTPPRLHYSLQGTLLGTALNNLQLPFPKKNLELSCISEITGPDRTHGHANVSLSPLSRQALGHKNLLVVVEDPLSFLTNRNSPQPLTKPEVDQLPWLSNLRHSNRVAWRVGVLKVCDIVPLLMVTLW